MCYLNQEQKHWSTIFIQFGNFFSTFGDFIQFFCNTFMTFVYLQYHLSIFCILKSKNKQYKRQCTQLH
jgi:hypothetical protein